MMEPNDGLAGVSDDELEGAVNGLLGGNAGTPQSRTPRQADPAARTQEAPGADPPEATLLQQLGYEDPETAVRSVRLLRNDRSSQETEKNTWKDRALAAEARLNGGEQRVSPAASIAAHGGVQADDPLKKLQDEYNVPADLLSAAIDARTGKNMESFLRPLVEMTQADQEMVNQYGPEYVRVKPQIEQWVAANPRVNEIVTIARQKGLPKLAAEYALGAYREALVVATHTGLQEDAANLQDQQRQVRGGANPLPQSRENTRKLLAERQSGGDIDPNEAIRRGNAGDMTLIDQAFASQLPSEERMLQVMRGW